MAAQAIPAIAGAAARMVGSVMGMGVRMLAGTARAGARLLKGSIRLTARGSVVKWHGEKFKDKLEQTTSRRVKIACQILRDRVVVNISRPVTKLPPGRDALGRFTAGRVANRSKPGESPRADTTRLMKDVFWDMISEHEGMVGTTLDYGAVLELSSRLDRSYLRRTLRENHSTIQRILTAPIK